MGKKQAITARKDAPVAAEEVKWKAYFSEIGALASEGDAEQRDAAMAKVVKAQAERIIQAMLSTEVNSITDHRLFVSLGVAELVSAISALDETAVNTPRVVVGVAHALTAAPPEFSGVLAEHVGFVEALTKLQKK